MNYKIKIYCDGAAMAYNDCADKIDQIIDTAPEGAKELLETFRPVADNCKIKAIEVYKEAELLGGAVH